jgi:uncharacterized repeat protein (TIGR03943 family)
MLKQLPMLQSLTRWVLGREGTLPTETSQAVIDKTAINKAAIDIWAYAEPASEEPDPLKRNVLQWRRLITSVREPLAIFPGQPVDIIGFVHRPFPVIPNQFVLARHIIRCCLADTVPLGLTVHIDNADEFTTETWLHIQGYFRTVDIHSKPTLVVIPNHTQVIPEPQKIYINGVF